MGLRARTCPHCGASVRRGADRCPYCGTWFTPQPAGTSGEAAEPASPAARSWLVLGLVGAAALYALGWRFEDTRYWLDERAVAVWAGAVPLWLAVVAFGWRRRRGWLLGVLPAVVLFIVHLLVTWAIAGRVQDDYVGIAAAYGVAALVGWVLGWGLGRVWRIK